MNRQPFRLQKTPVSSTKDSPVTLPLHNMHLAGRSTVPHSKKALLKKFPRSGEKQLIPLFNFLNESSEK